MRRLLFCLALCLCFQVAVLAAAKPKIVSFGRWITVKWMMGPTEEQSQDLKVRTLLVNGETKAYSTGVTHDITDKIFVVREAHRLNDMLPEDEKASWNWQPGGWIMVNRGTAHISKLTLPEYDAFYSSASWFRDFIAYCGVTDKDKLYAMVMQVGRRKPVVKQLLGPAKMGDAPNNECAAPVWLRLPMRVVFEPVGGTKVSFNVRGQSVEVPPDTGDEPEPNPNY